MTLTSIIHRELQNYVMFDMRCENCGPMRVGISKEQLEEHGGPIPEQMDCPSCKKPFPVIFIGHGRTKLILPFYDLAPNHAALDSIQVLSVNARPLARGQIVCFSEEPDIYHFAKIEDVFTNRTHMSPAGRPSVSFLIGGTDTGPIPHITGAETRPWWCWTDELPKTEREAEKPRRKTEVRTT